MLKSSGDGDTGQGMANQHRCAIVRLLQMCADRCGVVVKPDLPPGCGIPAVTGQIKADGMMPQLLKMTCTVVPAGRRRGRRPAQARRLSWLGNG